MGTLHRLARKGFDETFSPVNFRPAEMCRVMWFRQGDGNDYEKHFDAVGVQYAVGERDESGYHVIETPDSEGPLIRWTHIRPNATVCVQERKQSPSCRIYQTDEVQFVGLIFQFIRNRETGERWELIRGPSQDTGGGEYIRPFYDGLEKVPR